MIVRGTDLTMDAVPTSSPASPADSAGKPVDRRQWLRTRLDALKAEYLDVARDQGLHPGLLWAINIERNPLFAELHALERDLPTAEQYWMPVRFSL